MPLIRQLEAWINVRFCSGVRVLVVGAGTGAEVFAFARLGCEVYGVEPDSDAVEIIRAKAACLHLAPESVIQGVGEAIPFGDNAFDLVWCFTVLEHVQNVRRCIEEMIRVTKPLGRIFVVTPDYRQFWENHYKLPLPMFAPRWMVKVMLRWRRRPTKYFDTLQFVNAKQLVNIFMNHPVVAFQVIQSWPKEWKSQLTLPMRAIKWIIQHMGIQREQFWILHKLEKPR